MSGSDYKPKLIEVALPLAAINVAAAREKAISRGHPSTLHLWWARRPLAATRAVVWASLVDDPSSDKSLSAAEQEAERDRLFRILEKLVEWENTSDTGVLAEARAEIERCFPDGPPPILDPFAGGGAIPLEAQRLGLKVLAGDLNPVAVLINKAMIEIPPRFAGMPPVHSSIDRSLTTWETAQGLAADVEAYGRWMHDEAKHRIGHLYPDAVSPNGENLTPIAWIWARTVESPDPAWSGHVPLVRSWVLSKKPRKPKVWIEPIINRETQTISYEIREGGDPSYEQTVGRRGGVCVVTGSAMPLKYVRAEGMAGRLGRTLLAVVAEGRRGRIYCNTGQQPVVHIPEIALDGSLGEMPTKHRDFKTPAYGMPRLEELFTIRQLTALTTFSDLLSEVGERVQVDALAAGMPDNGVRLRDGGRGAVAYADAVVTYLAFVIDRCANSWSSICTWISSADNLRSTFSRQAIPMTWDFAECNPFSNSVRNWMAMVVGVKRAFTHIPASSVGKVVQQDARVYVRDSTSAIISTDPPYYDNISYADLSDFFYVWLRRNLADVWPDECATLLTPKSDELIANRYRAGSKLKAQEHFESGMAQFMAEVAQSQPPTAPATIYYAYKATEIEDGEVRTTGWDTFLQAVIDAGLQVTSTWPMRTEKPGRMVSVSSNALASSIVLACRPRPESATLATRGEFIAALRNELPEAVRLLQSSDIAPVDMAQSVIGPGIRMFSRYVKVLEANGSPMPVSTALSIINKVLGEALDGKEADLDADTRFALSWFSQHGYNPGSAGDADSVARAKNTSLAGIVESGIGEARAGSFRLFERSELIGGGGGGGWSPETDTRRTGGEALKSRGDSLVRWESK
ncbi:MAG: DUF1156 domain-containing protein, partial [Acidimicrobiaceae bacterium]|nr:DUF1156 domain-containing protein [Acidimicrobiaceae bacterium]